MTRECNRCFQKLPVDCFHDDKPNGSTYPTCKPCLAESLRLRSQGLKRCGKCFNVKSETDFVRYKVRLSKNCKDCYLEMKEKELQDKKNWYEAKGRWIALERKYGITKLEYESRLSNQSNSCAICRSPISEESRGSVDHNHDTGQIRGILCTFCNLTLLPVVELYEDKLQYIDEAKKYLEYWSEAGRDK